MIGLIPTTGKREEEHNNDIRRYAIREYSSVVNVCGTLTSHVGSFGMYHDLRSSKSTCG